MANQTAHSTAHRRIAFPFIAVLLILDQISKWWVVESMIRPRVIPAGDVSSPMPFVNWLLSSGPRLPFAEIEILPFFNLVMVWNRGVSFGLFSHDSDFGPMVLTITAILVMTAFCVWLMRAGNGVLAAGLTMVIGGAAGNVIDRVRFGAVVDFLDFHAAGYHWPAFNIADSCITVGIALILFDGLFLESQRRKSQQG